MLKIGAPPFGLKLQLTVVPTAMVEGLPGPLVNHRRRSLCAVGLADSDECCSFEGAHGWSLMPSLERKSTARFSPLIRAVTTPFPPRQV
jgi:hypothetical protein